MCKAVDVASYILQEKGRLAGYQLQKLLYYSQAWCLVTQDRPLFSEETRAWDHGPVVYEVFCEHARQRSVVQEPDPMEFMLGLCRHFRSRDLYAFGNWLNVC